MKLSKRDQEFLAMSAKMKTLEEQHQDYQRHIGVLKESLVAKEEHYSLLQADVEELRNRLEERNKLIEKKSQQTRASSLDRNKISHELQDLRDLIEVKDQKISVLQRKIENLDSVLMEKDNELEMTRSRLANTSQQQYQSSSHHSMQPSSHHHHNTQFNTSSGQTNTSNNLLLMSDHHSHHSTSLMEDTLGDKEKQISILRDQRDRAEHELSEERDSHERNIEEYKMKLHSLQSNLDKIQVSNMYKSIIVFFCFCLLLSMLRHKSLPKNNALKHKRASICC